MFSPTGQGGIDLEASTSTEQPKQERKNTVDSDIDDENFKNTGIGSVSPGIESYIGKNIPILILITIKLLSQHITGFLILIACYVGSRACNNKVRLFDRRTVDKFQTVRSEALLVISIMVINLALLFHVIEKEDGGKNVLFFVPVIQKLKKYYKNLKKKIPFFLNLVISTMSDRILTIFWLIVLSQFWMQFLEMVLKASVATFIPVSYHRKGFLYSFIQNSLTLYRWLLPMPQICAYLWSTKSVTNSHSFYASCFDLLLIFIYLAVKLLRIKDYVIGAYKSLLATLSSKEICEKISSDLPENQLCGISHVPLSRKDNGDLPVRITNVKNETNIVSEKALYSWLNLTSRDTKSLKCPITLEDLVYSNGENTNGVYRASSSTSYHIFLM